MTTTVRRVSGVAMTSAVTRTARLMRELRRMFRSSNPGSITTQRERNDELTLSRATAIHRQAFARCVTGAPAPASDRPCQTPREAAVQLGQHPTLVAPLK